MKKSNENRPFVRRFFIIVFAVLLPFLAASSCGKETAQNEIIDYSARLSYRDIPGITAEEIAAIDEIRVKRGSLSYAMNHTTECFPSDNGIGGYSSLFCEWLSGLFGILFYPEIVEWDELVSGLASFQFDFSGELTATDERQKIYFMTDPIAERPIKIMYITGKNPLPANSRNPVYAFLDGTTTHDLVSPYLDGDYNSLFVGDYTAAYNALKSGAANAFFEDGPAEAAFVSYGDVVAEDFFPLIYSPVSMATQNPELSPIISVVQKALESGAVYHLTTLYNEGYHDYLKQKLYMQLTQEEKEYIRLHNTSGTAISLAAEYDNYPAAFYNSYDRAWQGVALDILKEVQLYTGLHFEIKHEPYTEWHDILRMLEAGDASMVTELMKAQSREGHFLWADVPYLHDYYALLSATEYRNLNANEVLYSRVGLVADSAYADIFHLWFPHHMNTVEYTSNIDALNALAKGEVDLLMATSNQLLSVVNYLERPGFKVNIFFNHPSDSYFGFNINEATLCSIISKTQKIINTDDIFKAWERKVFDYRRKIAQARQPWLIGSIALLACMLSLVFILLNRYRREEKRLELLVKERTKELVAASEAAIAASHYKSEFLATMSHEIRTPINAVTGMTAIARSSSDLDRIYDCLDKINMASRQLLGLINDILDMSKIEAKRFDLVHEPFALESMARNVSSIIDVRTNEKKQKFLVDLAPDLPAVVVGDEVRFSQILLNLLSNAVKFTPEEGEICMTLRRLGEQSGKEEIEVSVQDSGIGITEEQKAKLFNAFVQANSSTVKQYGGTGLGLAISKSIAELMGGSISVQSEYGKGSCFTVRVFFELGTRESLEALHTSKVTEEYNFTGRTILLVEDIEINREIVTAVLEETGVTIDCAENGKKAVEMFSAAPERYDLIFMDLQMPVMDGYEATIAIRTIESLNERNKLLPIPIIAMTANAFMEDVAKCKEVGMNDHLAKPIEVSALLGIANKYLNML